MKCSPEKSALLLSALQKGLPAVPRPFAWAGAMANISEKDALIHLKLLAQEGKIRRFGAIFNPSSLGYRSTLCACCVAESEAGRIAAALQPLRGVTHCYLRGVGDVLEGTPSEEVPNLWFTFMAPGRQFDRDLNALREVVAPSGLLVLPSRACFKIEAVFGAAPGKGAIHRHHIPTPESFASPGPLELTAKEMSLIRRLQDGIPMITEPFNAIAAEMGASPVELLQLLAKWKKTGLLRRIAVVLNHQKMGLKANGLCAWSVNQRQVQTAGEMVASYTDVTHCYARSHLPAFPYGLYAMVHAGVVSRAREVFRDISSNAGLCSGYMLLSTREYKKTAPFYFEPEAGGEGRT